MTDAAQFSEACHDDSNCGNLAFVASQKTNIVYTFFWRTCAASALEAMTSNVSVTKEGEVWDSFGRRGLTERLITQFLTPPCWMGQESDHLILLSQIKKETPRSFLLFCI